MRLLVFGHNDWWIWRRQGFCGRNAALVRALARRDEVERIVVVDTPRHPSRTSRPSEARGRDAVDVEAGIVSLRHTYPLPLPVRWHPARRLNDALSRRGLGRRIAAALGDGGPVVLWVADPRLVEPAVRFPHDLFVFDAIDDWRHHEWAGVDSVASGYECARRSADLLLAVNGYLLDLLDPLGAGVAMPNAIDWDEWRDLEADPAALRGLRHPLVGQVGSLQERVDVGLFAAVAARLPDHDFAVIGPSLHDYVPPVPLPANVHLLGPLPHERIPGTLAAMDACVLLHHRDGIQRSMDPLKLYEYLAAGRPVVSTVASPNPRLAGHVRVATDVESVAAALVDEISGDDPVRREERRSVVRREGEGHLTSGGVWALIAHYGEAAATRATVASLLAAEVRPARILVIDNQGGFTCDGAEVERPGTNLGFTGAMALGIARALDAGADWVWLVNNDATVDGECLAHLLEAGDSHPRAGLLSPVIVYEDDGAVWFAGGSFDRRTMATSHWTRVQSDQPYATGYATGCALLARAAMVRACGPPDVSLFMYYDDVDWSRRAREAGWEVLVAPAARVVHGVPRAAGRRLFSPTAVYYLTRNRLLVAGRGGSVWPAVPGALSWGARQLAKAARSGGAGAIAASLARGLRDGVRGRTGALDDGGAEGADRPAAGGADA